MSEPEERAERDALLIAALQMIKSDEMRVEVTLKRGAEELDLLSKHYLGLRFTRLSYGEDLDRDLDNDRVHIEVAGSGEDLARHGFLDAGQLEAAKKCKAKRAFHDAQGCIEVRRLTAGFHVVRPVPLEMIAAALVPHVWSPKARLIR